LNVSQSFHNIKRQSKFVQFLIFRFKFYFLPKYNDSETAIKN